MRGQNFAPAAKTARPQKALPVPILEAIAWHHCPENSDDRTRAASTSVSSLIKKKELFRLKAGGERMGRIIQRCASMVEVDSGNGRKGGGLGNPA